MKFTLALALAVAAVSASVVPPVEPVYDEPTPSSVAESSYAEAPTEAPVPETTTCLDDEPLPETTYAEEPVPESSEPCTTGEAAEPTGPAEPTYPEHPSNNGTVPGVAEPTGGATQPPPVDDETPVTAGAAKIAGAGLAAVVGLAAFAL